MEIRRVKDDVYIFAKILGKYNLTVNVFFINDAHPSLIDTGTPLMGTEIKIALEDFNIDPGKIEYIFLTHEHPDHMGSLLQLLEWAYNAKVVAIKYMNMHLTLAGISREMKLLLDEGDEVNLGKHRLTIQYVPVETRSYGIFMDQTTGILFTGDYLGQLTTGEWLPAFNGDARELIDFMARRGYRGKDVKKFMGDMIKEASYICPAHGSWIWLNERYKNIVNKALSSDKCGSPEMFVMEEQQE